MTDPVSLRDDVVMKPKFRFVTCAQYPQGTADDQLVLAPLRRRGFEATFSIWNDSSVTWNDGSIVVLRSPWDYWELKGQFLNWLAGLHAQHVRLYNPFDTMKWNFDKLYLADIEKKGHLITPTRFHTFSGAEELTHRLSVAWQALREQFPWIQKMIVKPRVSANAWKTYVVRASDLAGGALSGTLSEQFKNYALGENLLIQPFLEDVLSQGEWSLFYFWGEWSHTCLKTPAVNDFRVQEEHGGLIRSQVAPENVKAAADAIARDFAKDLLYARVDIVIDQGRPLLMELELIEPSLYFRMSPDQAPENFARALERLVSGAYPN